LPCAHHRSLPAKESFPPPDKQLMPIGGNGLQHSTSLTRSVARHRPMAPLLMTLPTTNYAAPDLRAETSSQLSIQRAHPSRRPDKAPQTAPNNYMFRIMRNVLTAAMLIAACSLLPERSWARLKAEPIAWFELRLPNKLGALIAPGNTCKCWSQSGGPDVGTHCPQHS